MEKDREVLVEVNHLNVTYGSGRKAYKAVKNANFTMCFYSFRFPVSHKTGWTAAMRRRR